MASQTNDSTSIDICKDGTQYTEIRKQQNPDEKPSKRNSTRSERNNSKIKKTSTPTTIPEIKINHENDKNGKSSDITVYHSIKSSETTKINFPNETTNHHEEENVNRTTSSNRSLSKTPSDKSLEHSSIYHEQYCCFSKRTRCERYLLIIITILIFVIIVLVVAVIVLGVNLHHDSITNLFSGL